MTTAHAAQPLPPDYLENHLIWVDPIQIVPFGFHAKPPLSSPWMSMVGQSANTYILYTVHFSVCSLIEYSVEAGLLGECFRIGTPSVKVFYILLFIFLYLVYSMGRSIVDKTILFQCKGFHVLLKLMVALKITGWCMLQGCWLSIYSMDHCSWGSASPAGLSREPSDLSGPDPDSHSWLSCKVPPWVSIVRQSACTYILYTVHFSVCSLIEYSVSFIILPIIVIAVFIILEMYSRYFDPVTGKSDNIKLITHLHLRVDKHHTSQESSTSVLV